MRNNLEASGCPMIEVNDYGEDLKSLTFQTPNGLDATIGVLNPGRVQTVSTDRAEYVTVLSGKLRVEIPAFQFETVLTEGQCVHLPAGSNGITLEAVNGSQVAYKCLYIENPDGR